MSMKTLPLGLISIISRLKLCEAAKVPRLIQQPPPGSFVVTPDGTGNQAMVVTTAVSGRTYYGTDALRLSGRLYRG